MAGNNLSNREYKSDVFSMLMDNPEYALSVYNALNKSNLTDPSLVEKKRLETGISLSVRNDAAIDYCKEHDILLEFLTANEDEVKKVMTIDMTFERRLELNGNECREEGLKEGLQEGLQKSRKSTILYAYHNGHSVEEIHEFIGYEISEIEAAIAEEEKFINMVP